MLQDNTPRVLAVHDLSCFGRCALTVIIPAMSVMGAAVVPLPTALLSSHTGGFTGMTFLDLTDTMQGALDHYARMDLRFDAIYTGFLGSAAQIDTVSRAIDLFGGRDTPVLVDPVMGDDGVVYQTYTPEMCERMRELCRKADILTPNLTEAYLLCGEPYRDTAAMAPDAALAEAERLREKLTDLYGAKQLTLTGIELSDGRIATISYDSTCAAGREAVHIFHRIEHGYPGTGDLFASVLLGKLLAGMYFHDAADTACRIVAEMIADTAKYDLPRREGLRLEQNLWRLLEPTKGTEK